jgi:DNA-binding CsgD family transcriptional regulator
MRREARDIFAGIGAMIVATRVEAPRLPFADLLGGLFDLTPAESRLARAIAGGVTIQAYAATAMVSAETVRTQLKSVMSKTGTHRQTDLVRLLVATTPLGPSVHE